MNVAFGEAAAIVVKMGGEVVQRGETGAALADLCDLVTEGRRVVLVHGGGPQATALQTRLGYTPQIVAGRRITDRETLEIIKMTVAGQVNIDLCRALIAAGGKPVGLHGASALAIRARKRPPRVVAGGGPDPIDFGEVGDVVGVNEELLALLGSAGFLPVLSSLGADEGGAVYNINADAVANRVAIALKADVLLVVSDVPAVLRDLADPNSRVALLDEDSARTAIIDGTITKGMVPKLDEGFAALAAGVRSVVILGRLARGDLMRAVRQPGSVGTTLVQAATRAAPTERAPVR